MLICIFYFLSRISFTAAHTHYQLDHVSLQQPPTRRTTQLHLMSRQKLSQHILVGEFTARGILAGEVELGEQFSVSRTAVREAIKILAAKEIVFRRPRIETLMLSRLQWSFLDQDLFSIRTC